MTDSDEKPNDLLSALIRSARQQIDKGSGWIEMPLHEHLQFLEYVSRLLDTTRSERDAALREVEALKHDIESALDGLSKEAAERDAALDLLRLLWEDRTAIDHDAVSMELGAAIDAMLVALTPPAYPPEQPL